MINLLKSLNGKKKFYVSVSVFLMAFLVMGALALYLNSDQRANATAQASKVLIIGNDDTYYASGINGGSCADEVYKTLSANGFDATVWKETLNGGVPPTLATLNQYDLVIFSQGVGYRNTNNGKEGLNLDDLNLLKQYMNITSSGNKARLLIEGEDVMSDIIRVGTSTDQRDLLKISTSSSSDNYGTITQLNMTDTTHPIFNYPYNISGYPNAFTTYQQSFQDYIAPNLTVGARTIASANFSGHSSAHDVMNTWDDNQGHREVFIPFAWRVDGTTNNTINDYLVNGKQWRDQLLVNMATWVGERKINVTGTDISNTSASRGETSGMLSLKLTPSMVDTTVTPPNLSSLKVNLGGTIDQTKVTAKVYEDNGTIGVLDGADKEIGSATFSGGVATITLNSGNGLEFANNNTKYVLVVFQFATDTVDGSTATASLDANAFTVNSLDKLTRVYGTLGVLTNPTTVKIGGTAVLKTPAKGSTVGQSVTFTGTTSTGYTLSYTSGYNNTAGPWTQFASGAGAVSSSTLGVWNTSSGLPPDGGYTVKLEVSSGSKDYVNLYVDNTAPAITAGPSLSALRDVSATVSWTTDESSTSQVVYRVSPSGIWQNATSTTKVQQHTVALTQLTPNTSYEYKVVSADEVGNQVTSAVKTFATYDLGPVADITSPASVAGIAPRVSDTVPIKGSAYTNQGGHSVVWSVYYGKGVSQSEVTTWNLVYSGSNSVNNGLLTNWNAPLTDGAYVLWLAVRDPALTGVTAEYDIYLPVVVDNSKPQINYAKAVHITNSTADITWETSKLTVDEISYGSQPGILSYTFPDTDKDKDIFLYDLQPNTKYYFHVTATDNGGHITETPELTFTTTNMTGDTTPPVVSSVSLTAAGRTSSEIDLKWNAAYDASGVSGYKIFRSLDGVNWDLIGGSSGHNLTFSDKGLIASHLYYYCLTAVDPYGNESVKNKAIQVLTMSGNRINPHGAYTKLTVMCSKCHTVHRGKKEFLFNRTQEATMCYTCHDASGTGSRFAIEAEYDPSHVSRHPLPMNHTSKECASCHNPHLNATEYPRLLQSVNTVTGQVYHNGNGFCYNCHGVNGPDRILDNTAGPHDVFELSVHNLGAKIPSPASGTGVKCANCHANHASGNPRLTLAKEEESCYLCHGDNANKYGIRNAKQDITKTSFHNVNGNPTIGNVECVNCHNPHYVQSAQLNTSDPYETNIIWRGDRTTFCLTCHSEQHLDSRGDPHLTTPQKHVSRTENVPYTVYFPADPFIPTTIGSSTGTIRGWDKSGFIAPTSVHYNNGTKAVQCTTCHSPHGSAYQRMVSREEDSFRSDKDGSCSICHSANGVWRSVYGGSNIPDIYSQLTQTFAHPVLGTDSTYLHNDKEDYATTPLNRKHAECQDCHDPHQARHTGSKVGNLSGPLSNVRGVTRLGDNLVYTTGPATEDWQICYKCHSSYWQNLSAAGMRNIAAEFYRTTTYRSYHFVELTSNSNIHNKGTTGTTNHFLGRFTAGAVDHDGNPWTGSSKMYCQDCHGSPTGAKGPHGSPNRSMLKGSYYTFDETTRNMASDLICYRCHSETVYKSTSGDYATGGGGGHAISEGGEHGKPCWVCHGSKAHGTNKNHLFSTRNTAGNPWDPDYDAMSRSDGTGNSCNDPKYNQESSCSIVSVTDAPSTSGCTGTHPARP